MCLNRPAKFELNKEEKYYDEMSKFLLHNSPVRWGTYEN